MKFIKLLLLTLCLTCIQNSPIGLGSCLRLGSYIVFGSWVLRKAPFYRIVAYPILRYTSPNLFYFLHLGTPCKTVGLSVKSALLIKTANFLGEKIQLEDIEDRKLIHKKNNNLDFLKALLHAQSSEEVGNNLLRISVKKGNAHVVKMLCTIYERENKKFKIQGLLQKSIKKEYTKITKYLINAGAKITTTDINNAEITDKITKYTDTKLIKKLYQACDTNSKHQLFLKFISAESWKGVELLCDNGAKITANDLKNWVIESKIITCKNQKIINQLCYACDNSNTKKLFINLLQRRDDKKGVLTQCNNNHAHKGRVLPSVKDILDTGAKISDNDINDMFVRLRLNPNNDAHTIQSLYKACDTDKTKHTLFTEFIKQEFWFGVKVLCDIGAKITTADINDWILQFKLITNKDVQTIQSLYKACDTDETKHTLFTEFIKQEFWFGVKVLCDIGARITADDIKAKLLIRITDASNLKEDMKKQIIRAIYNNLPSNDKEARTMVLQHLQDKGLIRYIIQPKL